MAGSCDICGELKEDRIHFYDERCGDTSICTDCKEASYVDRRTFKPLQSPLSPREDEPGTDGRVILCERCGSPDVREIVVPGPWGYTYVSMGCIECGWRTEPTPDI